MKTWSSLKARSVAGKRLRVSFVNVESRIFVLSNRHVSALQILKAKTFKVDSTWIIVIECTNVINILSRNFLTNTILALIRHFRLIIA